MNILPALQVILVKDYKLAPELLTPGTHLSALGIDSLGLLELMFKIEDSFQVKISGDTPSNLVTVQDVCTYIEGLVAGQRAPEEPTAPPALKL